MKPAVNTKLAGLQGVGNVFLPEYAMASVNMMQTREMTEMEEDTGELMNPDMLAIIRLATRPADDPVST